MHTRILHVITSLETGGAQLFLSSLLSEMREDFDHHVLCLGRSGPVEGRLREAGVPIMFARMEKGRPVASIRQLRESLPYVFTIINGWMYHGNLASSLLKLGQGRHTSVVWCIRHSFGRLRDEGMSTCAAVGANVLAQWSPSHVVYNSTRSMLQHHSLGLRKPESSSIPNGVDLRRYAYASGPRNSVRTAWRVAETDLVYGCVARWHPMKGHPRLLRAFGRVLRDNMILALAGAGITWDNTQLVTQIRQAGLAGRVRLLGERHDIPAIMNGFDFLVVPSEWGEAFPNVVAEAMACGRPCIATDLGDTARIIGDTGWLVGPSDAEELELALEQAASISSQEHERLGALARSRVEERYSRKGSVEAYRNLYWSLEKEAGEATA